MGKNAEEEKARKNVFLFLKSLTKDMEGQIKTTTIKSEMISWHKWSNKAKIYIKQRIEINLICYVSKSVT